MSKREGFQAFRPIELSAWPQGLPAPQLHDPLLPPASRPPSLHCETCPGLGPSRLSSFRGLPKLSCAVSSQAFVCLGPGGCLRTSRAPGTAFASLPEKDVPLPVRSRIQLPPMSFPSLCMRMSQYRCPSLMHLNQETTEVPFDGVQFPFSATPHAPKPKFNVDPRRSRMEILEAPPCWPIASQARRG